MLLVVASTLVCDDDADIRSLVAAILEGNGFTVHRAHDVASALAVLEAEQIDVAVTDISLPDGSGVEVCRAAAGLQCQVVAITATVGPELAEELHAIGAVVLRKPFSLAELLAAVRG